MELETARWVIELVVGGFSVVVWFLLRKLIADMGDLEKALAAYKLHVAETYVTQSGLTKAVENFSAGIGEVFRKLERIEDKLDLKQDKRD